ncbi:MAG TPA: hypothetical protein VMU62_00640 [Acidobacteriaceae bacterium]|nr:hypothetical protein [Acidobacteriaceae bacterium]
MLAAVAFVLASALGCGDTYRPIVTNIPPVQPAPQPSKFALVITCGPGVITGAVNINQVCTAPSGSPVGTVPPIGLGSIVDFSGDSLMVRINLGNGPRWIGLNGNGGNAYTANADGTINTFGISTRLETNQILTSTLLPGAAPSTLLAASGGYLYVVEPGRNSIAVMQGTPPAVQLEIPITASNPVNMVGNYTAQRVYAIAQGANTTCPTTGTAGTITAIEKNTNTISAVIPSGVCPTYGIMSQDNKRAFVLNQGSGTITVIDSQQNQLDLNPNNPNNPNTPYFKNGTIDLSEGTGAPQGPVWADIYNNGSILAVVNSLANTLTLINVSLDSFGNDSPSFGQIIATVPVGNTPSSVAVLQDGTRAYVANYADQTVSVVSLTSNQVLHTIPVSGHPISIAATTGTPTGKVYVVSPDSNVMTIIRTDNDTVSNSLVLTGNGIQVRVTAP